MRKFRYWNIFILHRQCKPSRTTPYSDNVQTLNESTMAIRINQTFQSNVTSPHPEMNFTLLNN